MDSSELKFGKKRKKKVHKDIPVLNVGFSEVENLLERKAHNEDKGEDDSLKKENIVRRF